MGPDLKQRLLEAKQARKQLEAGIQKGLDQLDRGEGIPAEEVYAELLNDE